MSKVVVFGIIWLANIFAAVNGLNEEARRTLSNASRESLPNASYVSNHLLRDKLGVALKGEASDVQAQVDGIDIVIPLDNRILHCPSDSELERETQHSESDHVYSNFVVKTGLFSFVIACGLICNVFVLAILQYFQVSPMRAVMRAEAVAATAYLVILIPLYPVANFYPYTGKFELYEVAKPYVTSFFQTCLDITEFLYIWMFLWLNKLRYILIVHYDSRRAERCTAKSTRDELRLMTCLAIVLNLPKYFDSDIKSESDPCKPGTVIVVSLPNILGNNPVYILFYQVFLLSLVYYVIPFLWLAKITLDTNRSMSHLELEAGETRQSIMQERSKTSDGITTELDKRVLMFYVLLLPGAFFAIAKYIQLLLPTAKEGYDKAAEVSEIVTMLLSTVHAAFAPFSCYMIWYESFLDKAKETYWERIVHHYRQHQRRRQFGKDFQMLEDRLRQEELNSTVSAGFTTPSSNEDGITLNNDLMANESQTHIDKQLKLEELKTRV